jgi:3-phosphoshikimate 1-carboxyvinyltransferase
MAQAFRLSCPTRQLQGTVDLERSKSISNRALIIRSLCNTPFTIQHLSQSDDTDALVSMLEDKDDVLYSGHAGSSYRFMVARACLYDREVTINASEQLRRRPIGPLVNALRALGAEITYLNKEGFPPLKVTPVKSFGTQTHEVTMQAGISSQYITALMMIAPLLPKGLTIQLTDTPVSESYIRMTLAMMDYFGIQHSWAGNTIRIEPGAYVARDYDVEGDWSAASYYYAFAALSEKAEIHINGLYPESLQGDAVVKDIYQEFGVETEFVQDGVILRKNSTIKYPKSFEFDFSRCPDIAQTVMVTLAGLGIKGHLKGLRTLRIKETDRIHAMQTELARVKIKLEVRQEENDLAVDLYGKAKWKDKGKFDSYEDHRMAMAFSSLSALQPVIIKEPFVVSKSYPGFWTDIQSVGIKLEKIKSK